MPRPEHHIDMYAQGTCPCSPQKRACLLTETDGGQCRSTRPVDAPPSKSTCCRARTCLHETCTDPAQLPTPPTHGKSVSINASAFQYWMRRVKPGMLWHSGTRAVLTCAALPVDHSAHVACICCWLTVEALQGRGSTSPSSLHTCDEWYGQWQSTGWRTPAGRSSGLLCT